MEKERQVLVSQGFTVETKISPGNAKREINRIAQEDGYPLVIVGSRGHSLLGGAFLGGVASEVMLNSRKPLLIIRLDVTAEGTLVPAGAPGESLGTRVLYTTDFSPASERAFEALKAIAASKGVTQVDLLHVQDQNRFDPHLMQRLDEFNAIDSNRLAKLEGILKDAGVPSIERHVVYGEPYVEIMRMITTRKSTLVVMGSQGRGFLRELFVGSVSQYIARKSGTSVLLVPYVEEQPVDK
jgi:nucleotide-binding universal stress UspA family protein